ncbi:hypothetical protein B0A50_04646 [Salinomyces thailandicus]|uniref:Uncharacterized protein n=1 Tax=Salinomyces thailandicus TaxID=706561 RepID=A0A4V5N477_9PEZI|nr:hypothetical protein B0A50_04646 [Salinomyces thailandica]
MEDGTATYRGGSDDRPEGLSRRYTISEPIEYDDTSPQDEASFATEGMKFPWSSPSTSAPSSPVLPTSPASQKSSGRKSSFSGSILQKLNFLRHAPSDAVRLPARDKDPSNGLRSRKSVDDDAPTTSLTSPAKGDGAATFAFNPVKMRKRTGSLRKTALLGGKRILSEGRERRNSSSAKSPLSKTSSQRTVSWEQAPPAGVPNARAFGSDLNPPVLPSDDSEDSRQPSGPRRQFSYESTAPSSSESTWSSDAPSVTAARLSLVTEAQARQHLQAQNSTAASSANELDSPLDIKSPVSQTSYTSTTSDDDILTFDRPSAAKTAFTTNQTPPEPLPSSLLDPTLLSQQSTRKRHQERSPLSHAISSSSLYNPPDPPPHDYTETESWGWIILVATWLTFAIGMGSCLDLWSWAWDVGETPYAPPELEDDATLPIVGYYPALMVLTGVVAWCWITVAWVGMKYFRHAKIEV